MIPNRPPEVPVLRRHLLVLTALCLCVLALVWARAADASRDARHLRRLVHPCLAAIVDRESGWRVDARNPSSGAYGLPQALPGSKMRAAGSDWRSNPLTQLVWMIGYVTARYGGPCEALAFHKQHGWY